MLYKPAILVVISFIALVLICGSASQLLAMPRQAGPVECRFGGPGKVMCCQDRPGSGVYSYHTVTWCTMCDNTNPPSNCSPRYCVAGCTFASPVGNNTGLAQPPPNAPPGAGNKTGPPPLGSIIKVPPGTTSAGPPSGNTTGSPVAATSSDNPPGCSKQIPIPPNCTINPFPSSGASSAQVQPGLFKSAGNITNAPITSKNTTLSAPTLKLSTQSLQQVHHHHKGGSGTSSSSSTNSTGHSG